MLSTSAAEVACLGELFIDMQGQAEETLATSAAFSRTAAGAPANVAVAAARLGAKVSKTELPWVRLSRQ